MRAANPFTVTCAYTIVFFRIMQLIGLVLKKRLFAEVALGIITFFMFLMWFNEFSNESADIVHDAEPTDDIKYDWKMMMRNYNPLN